MPAHVVHEMFTSAVSRECEHVVWHHLPLGIRWGEIVRPSPEELGSLSLFAGLGPAELEKLASWFDVEERNAGASLTRQGAAGYAFFVIREGTATVIQDDEEIRQLGPGDFFGELSIIGDGRRTATVKATSPVTVWNMFGTQFRSLEQQFPKLAERIRTAYA